MIHSSVACTIARHPTLRRASRESPRPMRKSAIWKPIPEIDASCAFWLSIWGNSVRSPLAAKNPTTNHGKGDFSPMAPPLWRKRPARRAIGVIQITRVSFTTFAVSNAVGPYSFDAPPTDAMSCSATPAHCPN